MTNTYLRFSLNDYLYELDRFLVPAQIESIHKAYAAAPNTVLAMLDDIASFRVTIEYAITFFDRISTMGAK